MNTSIVPVGFELEKSLLPEPARRDFDFWCERFEPLLDLRRGIEAKLREIATETDTPFRTVKNKFYDGKRNGITAWIDKRLAGPRYWNMKAASLAVAEEDQELIKFYCEANQRSSRAAVKQLRRDWVRRRPTDALKDKLGTTDFEKVRQLLRKERVLDKRTSMPRGWSIDNLVRYAPTPFELKSARIGRAAAASEAPLVYTTRQHLWVGSHYQFDDMWHDLFVNTFSEKQAGRPLELFSHDLFSGRKVRWGVRVRTRKDDGSYNALTERMTRFVLAATLFLDGYSPRGTVIFHEHGTADVPEEILAELHRLSGGLITSRSSGMTGAKAHAGQYPGLVRGNPRAKASLESSNNLTHNVFASLPGQTGKDVASRPEELDGGLAKFDRDGNCTREAGMLAENAALLAAYDQLTPERAALLQFPILELQQFMAVAHELYAAIENDPDHSLEGWDLNTVNELCLAGQWVNQARLLDGDPAQAELALSLINTGKLQTRPRKMSRREVWDRGAGELIKLPGHGVCAILGADLAEERSVNGSKFEFRDHEVGPGTHRYEAIAVTPWGERIQLRHGEKYQTFVNPFAPDTLFVRRANGSYVGECRRIDKVCAGDLDAVHRACGEAARRQSELLRPIRQRHLADARAKMTRQATNAVVLSGGPVTFTERCKAIAMRKMDGGNVSELAEPDEPAAADEFEAPSEPELSAEGLL